MRTQYQRFCTNLELHCMFVFVVRLAARYSVMLSGGGFMFWYNADCYLRQGAGGTEFARFGSRTCFLRWFYKRSQTHFGQKPEEHRVSIKNHCLEVKNVDFWEKMGYGKKKWSKTDFLIRILNDSAWFCMEKLKKHSFETKKQNNLPKTPQQYKRIRKQLAFEGAFKGPCTLP